MIKKYIIYTLVLIPNLLMMGQGQKGDFEVAINPTALPYTESRLGISFEKSTGKNTSISLSLGYGNALTSAIYHTMYGISSDDENYQLYEARPELKYYLPFFSIPAYLSCEVFYLHLQKTVHDDWFMISSSNIHINYDRADFTKKKYGITLIGGLKPYILNDKYYLEMFSGLGIAKRETYFKNVITNNANDDFYTLFDSGYHTQGSRIVVNMVVGIRIGIVAKKR